jgi:hypothetical protein
MYLLYDVLQLRNALLGNAFLVKRRNWRAAEDDIASLTIEQLEDAAEAVADGGVIDDPVIQRLQRSIVSVGNSARHTRSALFTLRSARSAY